MVRIVEEAVEVRLGDAQHMRDGGRREDGCAAPEQFLWRGRLYRVTGVVDHWQERHPWWRAAGERPLAEVPLAREVWRVEASPGRAAAPGVYDLGVDGDVGDGSSGPVGPAGSSWRLLRTQD